MALQAPEVLLTELNSALRRLRGTCTELDDDEIDHALLRAIRRLLIAEVLSDTWVIAVGGSQGAGKTTLLATLYELGSAEPSWLQANEGRGEKMPVLVIEEKDRTISQGYVRRLVPQEEKREFYLEDVQVDLSEFERAIYDPCAEDLLPVLRVPQRYFQRDNQAWLLLPGYEKVDDDNESWQSLMQQAMIAAGGCVVVTDETRLANQQQLEIVKDMLEHALKGRDPYVVVSKTEAHRNNTDKQAELRASAQTTFQVANEFANTHIILTGTDDPTYVDEWLPLMKRAIQDLNFSGNINRQLQFETLATILKRELRPVLRIIKRKADAYFHGAMATTGGDAQLVEEFLQGFELAEERLRKNHQDIVTAQIGAVYSKAVQAMDKLLIEDHEGFQNWMKGLLDSTTESKLKVQELVKSCWTEAAEALHSNYAEALTQLTLDKLGRVDAPTDTPSFGMANNAETSRLVKLGYLHAGSNLPVRYDKLNAERVSDIRQLLGDHPEPQHEFSSQIPQSIELLPIVALEYARLVYAVPEIVGDGVVATQANLLVGSHRAAVDSVNTLKAGVELGKTAIRSIATLLAVDVATDGKSDILAGVFGQQSQQAPESEDDSSTTNIPLPLMPHPVAIAAVGLVATAHISAKTIARVRVLERKASMQAHTMLASVRDQHIVHFNSQFSQTMDVVRERLRQKLRARYRMDESLMRKDRLAKAIADVESLTKEMHTELLRSSSGI
ncbi:sugar kinase [Alcaligenes faecalis]|nr:sugar kinase [Alcaligenes faecalis]